MQDDLDADPPVWTGTRKAVVAALILVFFGSVAGQTVPPAPGPEGRAPANAPSPAATATSPGTSAAPRAISASTSPAPEARSTSPGDPGAPPDVSTPTVGIPPRIAAPDAPVALPDPVDPIEGVAPSDQSRQVRRAPAAPGTQPVPNRAIPESSPPPAPAPTR